MITLLWVALGGAAGAVLRYLVVRAFSADFPYGTLLVNVSGSFLIGIVAVALFSDPKLAPGARLFFQTGLLGAFTTFSAFSLETLQLWQSGHVKSALLNVTLNVFLCLLATALGMLLGAGFIERLR